MNNSLNNQKALETDGFLNEHLKCGWKKLHIKLK